MKLKDLIGIVDCYVILMFENRKLSSPLLLEEHIKQYGNREVLNIAGIYGEDYYYFGMLDYTEYYLEISILGLE